MIICDVRDNAPVISGNVGEKSGFSIKASRQSFAILSSGLYKYKIRAIVRELSCNARDAMVAAGLDQNFYVHLPTKMEPEFIVKDEGLGLTHDDVMTLYTTYFESTKGNSNLFVGALGLGSKSPFCYTENFTVTSVKDGIRGVYSAFIGEDGFPAIIQLYSGPTDEHNGVEVRIAVDAGDYYTFTKEAKSIYRWFDVKPECNLDILPDYDIRVSEGIHHTEVSGNDSIIVMGGVAYTFNLTEFVPDAPNIKFVFKLPIGSVDVLPSREGLQNTKKTKEAIIAEFGRISGDAAQGIRLSVDGIDSTYDKIAYLTASDNAYVNYLKKVVLNEKLGGQNSIYIKDLEASNIIGVQYSIFIGKKSPKKFTTETIRPSKDYVFIHNDNKSSIKAIRECAPKGHLVMIFSPLDKTLPVDMDAFQKNVLLGAKILKASDFVVVTKRQYVSVSRKNPLKIMVAQEKRKKHSWSSTEYKLALIDFDISRYDFKYFVRLNAANGVDHPSYGATVTNIVNAVGIKNVVFIKDKSKFDTTNLINFFDFIQSEIDTLPKYVFDLSYTESSFINHIYQHSLNFTDVQLNNALEEYKISITADDKIIKYMRTLGLPDTRKEYDSSIFEKFAEKYESINFDYTNSETIRLLVDTINNQKEIV